MTTLVLKLVLTPLLVAGASLAGRRWGAAVSGWLVALPLTSAPIAAFLVAEHGSRFAARSAVGSLSGVAAEAAFCLGYAWTARRGWPLALAAAIAGFAGAGAVVEVLPLSARLPVLLALFAAALATLGAGLVLLPPVDRTPPSVAPPARWDIPGRALAATAIVIALTEAATTVGARLTGLLAVFPVYVSVLAVFGQRTSGSGAARALLRGVLLGLVSFASFFLVLGALLARIDPVAAFACAAAAALAAQALTLGAVRKD